MFRTSDNCSNASHHRTDHCADVSDQVLGASDHWTDHCADAPDRSARLPGGLGLPGSSFSCACVKQSLAFCLHDAWVIRLSLSWPSSLLLLCFHAADPFALVLRAVGLMELVLIWGVGPGGRWVMT